MNFWLNIQQKMRLVDYCPNISMETISINTENNKANEPRKFVLNLLQRLDLRSSNEHCFSSKLIHLLHVENIREQRRNNELKIVASTWNDEFELRDGNYLVLDIQDYIKYILKKD